VLKGGSGKVLIVEKIGEIAAHEGSDEVFDEANKNFTEVEAEFEECRKEIQSQLKTQNVTYKDLGKDLYLLEIPAKIDVPSNWKLVSKTQVCIKCGWSEIYAQCLL
jgi:DNA mismatch repair protein MSH6